MNGQLIFVSSDNSTGKLGVDDRQLIRSRCMQGVNKKESSRRSLRASRRAARLPHPAQEYRVTSRHEPGAKVTADAVDPADLTTHSVSHDYPVAHSRGLDLEILQFIHQDTVLYPREFTFNFTAFKQVKAIISPLFNSLYFDDMEDDGYQWLVNDTPFRHAIVLMVSAYRECSAEGHLSAMSRSHHHATVNSLNKRLSSTPEHFLIDTTIFIINVLATVAAWLGRHDEFTVHMRGLGQVVRLRGGKDFLYRRPFIRYHLQCLSLADSLSTGRNSSLSDIENEDTTGPQLPRDIKRPMSVLLESINRLVDHKLVLIYSDLQEITAQLNRQSTVHELLDFSTYQLHYNSISRRLLDLKATPLSPVSECFRLGLLAFLASATFRSPKAAAHAQGQFAYITENYRQKCKNIDPSTPQISTLLFWLLTIGAVSVFDIHEEAWLVEKWNAVTMTIPGVRLAWEDARPHLETVLWIRDAHEEMGKKAYQRLMRSELQEKRSNTIVEG